MGETVANKLASMFKNTTVPVFYVPNMTDELPLFPTTSPSVFRDRTRTAEFFDRVFDRLVDVVDATGTDAGPDDPTPCTLFTVGELRRHVLAWLQFFAAALDEVDPADRLDPDTWRPGPDDDPRAIVRTAAATFHRAIDGGIADRLAVMSSARMAGDGVLGMALGEYIIHGWDLARSAGLPYDADDDAAESALAFLQAMVAPEYRGPESGFFDAEVPAPEGASPLERLLCFAGRNPQWAPRA